MGRVDQWLYLPGLGTGTRTRKGAALAQRLAPRGVALDCLDLRVPSFRQMRLSAMVSTVREALDARRSNAVLIGTSFGGYVAAEVAATDPRVKALVLYAPALHLGELATRYRWLARVWRLLGFLPVPDKTERRLRRLGPELLGELEALAPVPPHAPLPTLIVHGRRDLLVPHAVSLAYARGRPHVRLMEVDDGHDMARSLPKILDETVRFLEPWL
jgi:pimeloyl-ACP methyl ester carboxylesterase